jgi:aspartoacylase
MKNILLLGSQHGNELLGDKLYRRIQSHHDSLIPNITFMLANPKAHEMGVRYIESDMNRSYGINAATYEAAQAKKIEALIRQNDYDLILDLHTTVCSEPPCIIIEDIYDENIAFLKASSITNIVLMQHPLVKTSLIGRTKRALAIEMANEDITNELLDSLCEDLRCYVDKVLPLAEKSVYRVSELLLKSAITPEEATKLVNFTMSAQGFIPILVGENSYKKNTEYLGFIAPEQHIIEL